MIGGSGHSGGTLTGDTVCELHRGGCGEEIHIASAAAAYVLGEETETHETETHFSECWVCRASWDVMFCLHSRCRLYNSSQPAVVVVIRGGVGGGGGRGGRGMRKAAWES